MIPELFRTSLEEIGTSGFLERYWQKEHLVLRGTAGRFAGLLPSGELNRILTEHSWNDDRLRLFRQGQFVPAAQYQNIVEDVGGHRASRIDGGKLAAEMRAGALIALSQIQQFYPAIQRLARDFEYFFRDPVNVNAYIGLADSFGFTTHWDDHEVFVLQVSGRKHWRIYGRTEEAPMYRDLLEYETAPWQPVWEGDLNDGDLLYLPRGCWHDARGLDEPTIHLSVGIDCSIGVHLIQWLTSELRKSELFRRDLPRFASAAERRSHVARLREELLWHFEDDILDRFLAAQDSAALAHPECGLPASAGFGEGLVRWVPPRPVDVQIEVLGRFVEIEALGRKWMLPRISEPLVRALAEFREMPLAEVRRRFGDELPALEHYLEKWAAEGLIEILPAEQDHFSLASSSR